MSSTSGGNPLEEQKKYYLEAYGIVSSAITLEENAKKSNNVAQGNIAAYQMYKRASELLLEAQKLEFPQDQWNSASEVQQKVWRAYQMASMRARELRALLPKEVLQSQKMQTTQTQPSISNVIDTIGKISLGKYSQEGMTRDEQINAHKAKAQEVINSVQPNSSQSHLGLPNNVGELTNLIAEAALLPKPGIPKVMQQQLQQPIQEAITINTTMNTTMNGLEQLKKTQFYINALANEPNQHWNKIHWYPSIPDAIEASKAADLPIFLEVVVGRLGEKESELC